MSLLSAVAPVAEADESQTGLTAVERFSRAHDAGLEGEETRSYHELIPLARPRPGQQYAFEVDLDACTGCKACVSACHSLNGLDEGETWRSVTLLQGGTPAEPFRQTVTAACHHCLDPACLKGCPVGAYEKDDVTGIVRHLDDQCIGCRYCTLTCPYEVPAYDTRRGIVRKCDMCQGRLEAGEAPACVQGCPNEAIRISVVDVASARVAAAAGRSVPGAAPSSITVPTTVYLGALRRAPAAPTGAAAPERAGPATAHPPLAAMLVLTQLAVGAFVLALVRGRSGAGPEPGPGAAVDAGVAVASGVLALAASVLHLGRPRYAYRAVIGIRHSWLSREVLAFGGFTGLAVVYAGVVASGIRLPAGWTPALGWMGAAAGAAGVACSVMIYASTRRLSWSPAAVGARFLLTSLVCGAVALAWAAVVTGRPASARLLLGLTAAAATAKLVGEATVFLPAGPAAGIPVGADRARRARLLRGELRRPALTRFGLGALAGVILPLAAVWASSGAHRPGWAVVVLVTGALGGTVAAELAERSLFFTTAGAPR